MAKPFDELLLPLMDAAHAAGRRIMADWQKNGAVTRKDDGSPVTETDKAAEDIIIAALKAVSPLPIIAEEQASAGLTPAIQDSFWLVDALDGTRGFIKGEPDFTVNIACIENHVPVFGIIHAPAHGLSFYAQKDKGAFCIRGQNAFPIKMRQSNQAALDLLSGVKSAHPVILEPFIGPHTVANRGQRNSSLKFCLLAQGDADLYPRLGPTYEWDTAAGDIILREAGGVIVDMDTKQLLRYGKTARAYENSGFVAGARDLFKPLAL